MDPIQDIRNFANKLGYKEKDSAPIDSFKFSPIKSVHNPVYYDKRELKRQYYKFLTTKDRKWVHDRRKIIHFLFFSMQLKAVPEMTEELAGYLDEVFSEYYHNEYF